MHLTASIPMEKALRLGSESSTEIQASVPGVNPVSKHPEIKYATGLSLLGLTSGLSSVDSLIGGLKSDTIALLTGSGICLEAAERYCIRAQLPGTKGGLGRGAYFIDGGNSFDIYMFTALARKHRLGYDSSLERQLIARAFTIYELSSLIESAHMAFIASKPKLLVVSEIFSLFTADVDRYESRRVFRRIVSSLSEISKSQQVPILLTSSERHKLLTPMLEESCCNLSVDIVQEGDWIKSSLLKHQWKAPVEIMVHALPTSYNQDTLHLEAVPRG
jgi:hypothetical protein